MRVCMRVQWVWRKKAISKMFSNDLVWFTRKYYLKIFVANSSFPRGKNIAVPWEIYENAVRFLAERTTFDLDGEDKIIYRLSVYFDYD